MKENLRVGTAGWSIPAALRDAFPPGTSLLQRYAGVFSCVEINSSFYRPHRVATYERWARSVPAEFRFALKVPREITHERRLVECADPLDRFLAESAGLGEKRAVLLVQLPPRFAFDASTVEAFLALMRSRYDGAIVCEPRNASWFGPDAEALLRSYRVARAAADPAIVPEAAPPGGWNGFRYYRLHGSPRIYWSAYGEARVAALAQELASSGTPAWVIFDNTAAGAAAQDARSLGEFWGTARKHRPFAADHTKYLPSGRVTGSR